MTIHNLTTPVLEPERLYKVEVYVTEEALQEVLDAITEAGYTAFWNQTQST